MRGKAPTPRASRSSIQRRRGDLARQESRPQFHAAQARGGSVVGRLVKAKLRENSRTNVRIHKRTTAKRVVSYNRSAIAEDLAIFGPKGGEKKTLLNIRRALEKR